MMINMTGRVEFLNSSPKSNGEEGQVELSLSEAERAAAEMSFSKRHLHFFKSDEESVTMVEQSLSEAERAAAEMSFSQRHLHFSKQNNIVDEESVTMVDEEDVTEAFQDSTTMSHWVHQKQEQMQMFFEPDEAVGLGAAVSDRRNHKDFVKQRRAFGSGEDKAKKDKNSVEYLEARARRKAIKNPFTLFFLHFYAGVKIMIKYLITLDSVVGCILTVGMTWFWYYQSQGKDGWNGTMSFVLVTFAVVSPITVAIRMAFQRREDALKRIASIRSYFQHIYFAHALWDWKAGTGRSGSPDFDFLGHCDSVLEQLIAMGDELARFLSLPNTSRGWNRTTMAGRAEAVRTVQAAYGLLDSVTLQRMARLTVCAEQIKKIGLSGSEISRVRAFERHLSDQLEQLRMLKMYRTPQALWSFARVFTIILPAFYAPSFAQVAHELQSLPVGIVFSVLTTLVLTALLEAVQVLEDPFTAYVSLDGIDVREEFEVLNFTQLVKARKLFFPAAPEYPLRASTALTGRMYDPAVHYHATDEEREALTQFSVRPSRPTNKHGAPRVSVWSLPK